MPVTAPRFGLPRFLQQGRGETLDFPVYAGPSSVAPASGTFTLLDEAGETVVTGAVVVTAGVATFVLVSTFADDVSLPVFAWRERWALVGLSGQPTPMTFERTAQLCRVAPHQVLGLEDLYRMHPEWRRQLPQAYSSDPSIPVDDAWVELIQRLLGDGHIPGKILNWFAFATVHKYWAAHLICRAWQTDAPNDSRWSRLADAYWKRATEEYEQRLKLQTDSDEDGVADTPNQLDAAEPQLFLTEVPYTQGRWRDSW